MLTLFTIPKPFAGAAGLLQEEALRSWLALEGVQVVLVGEAPGAVPAGVERGEALQPQGSTSPQLDDAFGRVDAIARHPLRCCVNADIVLLPDLLPAVEAAAAMAPRFLLVGRTHDVDPARVAGRDADGLRALAAACPLRGPAAIDWLVFPAGLFDPLPPFNVGRATFDNWMVWRARQVGPVVDATEAVTVIHQAHGYEHLAGGKDEAYYGPEAARNLALAGGKRRLYTLNDASHRMRPDRSIVRHWGATLRAEETLRRVRATAALAAGRGRR